MEFRKIYIKRLMPVLGIILILILTLVGHESLKAQAKVADEKEKIRQTENCSEKIDEEELKREISEELKSSVETIFDEKMEVLNLSDYFSEEELNSIYERIEMSIFEGNDFETDSLSEEQKNIIDSLISEALSLYSQMNMSVGLDDAARAEISSLIDESIANAVDDLYKKIGQEMSDMKKGLVMSDAEKSMLVKEISEKVQHDILEYVTEHIQLLYEGEGGGSSQQRKLVCEKDEHVHSGDCYERDLSCELEEDENHIHSDECYEYMLICEVEEHIHDEDCYKLVENDGEDNAQGKSCSCVHVHVDYLLTDDDRAKIVEDILNGTDLADVLSSVFYQEIEKNMSEIVKDKIFESVLETLSKKLDEIIDERLGLLEERLLKMDNAMTDINNDVEALTSRVSDIENRPQTIRYNEVTGMIECFSDGEWKPFMSASSIWVNQGLIYSSGQMSDDFEGFEDFAIASSAITYSETENALAFSSRAGYVRGASAENTYITNPNKPFEYSAEYNTIRIDYGLKATNTYVSHHKSDGSTEKCYYYNQPTMTVQVVDYATKEVYSSKDVSSSSATLSQGVMELELPNNPYYIKVSYKYSLSGTSQGEASGKATSSAAYIYAIQCVKK